MWNKKSKISNVVWEDDDKTLMKISFEGIPDVVLESIESKSWLAQKAKKQFSPKDIDKATIEYYKKIGEQTIALKEFVDNYGEWMEWKHEKENSLIRASNDLNHILSISHNKDNFFKLKLQVFEIDDVKASSNRPWKTKLRKAQSSLELLALLYQELPDLGNEPILPLDEILDQDVTNQTDNNDLNQPQVSESSDSATE